MPNDPPGFGARVDSEESEVLWSGVQNDTHKATQVIVVDSTAVDSGNTPTTTLRGGLVLAQKIADSNFYPYLATATDGREDPVGILEKHLDMMKDGVVADKTVNMLVNGRIKSAALLGSDKHAEALLAQRGFILDGAVIDGAFGFGGCVRQLTTTGDYTVLAANHRTRFVATTADVDFTLPTIANGLYFEFMRLANFELKITGSTNIYTLNNAAATSLTWSTTAEQIGLYVSIEAMYLDGTLLWVPRHFHSEGMTLVVA